MTDILLWAIVVLVGVATLGLVEVARSGVFRTPRWRAIMLAVQAALLLTLTATAAVLAVAWVMVVVMPEIWKGFLAAAGAVVLLLILVRRRAT